MPHVISIMGSPAQKSKLRNGHKVRIKHGSGFNVIVSPNTYHVVSRAFLKNKGISLQLTPEELSMNKAPSPEMQRAIMGHKEHMIIPGVKDHINMGGRGLGTGVTDWFKNLGNNIKSGFENQIINPVKENIVNPVKENIVNPVMNLYNKHVPDEVKRDINTGLRFSSAPGLAIDFAKRLKNGEKIQDIGKTYFEDLKHLNNTKNKIIKSNPALTEAYKKGVMATAGLGSAAVGSAFGLSPVTGALVGAAGAKGAEELLKAEGYGIHHAIDVGMRHAYHKLKKHYNPIEGGALGAGHFRDFFKHAGKTVKSIANFGGRQANKLNEFVLNNPALGKKIVEHGSKLAGLLAKEGVKYLTGDEKLGELAGNVGTDFGEKGLKKAGYGEEKPKHYNDVLEQPKPNNYNVLIQQPKPKHYNDVLEQPKSETRSKDEIIDMRKYQRGEGLYAGRQGKGMEPHSRLIGGGGFNSYESLQKAAMGYSDANALLGKLSDRTFGDMHYMDPIKKYWDEEGQPPSRGSGLHKNHHGKVHHRRKIGFERYNHYNLVRGRGSLIEHSELPPALQSQPYGANFHMQNMLPPQYHKYNDGTNEY